MVSLTPLTVDNRSIMDISLQLRIIIIHKALERLYDRQNGEIEALRAELAQSRSANEKLAETMRYSQTTIGVLQKDLSKQKV